MGKVTIAKSITVDAAPEACWDFWADPMNFKNTFDAVIDVQVESETRSRWTLQLPSGKTEEIEMQRSGESPEMVQWLSMGGPIGFANAFRFKPSGTGTSIALDSEIEMDGLQGMMLPAMKPKIEERIGQVLDRFKNVIAG